MRRVRDGISSVISLAFLAAGCGGPAATVKSSRPSIQGPIGVLALTADDTIEVYQQNYRVLTLTFDESTYTFAGLWDPAPALTDQAAAALTGAFGLVAEPVGERFELAARERIRAAHRTSFAAARSPGVPSAEGVSSLESEFQSGAHDGYLEGGISPDLQEMLWARGYRHLLEVVVAGISMHKMGLRGPTLRVFAHGRLVRLQDARTVWTGSGKGEVGLEKVSGYAELEANGLLLLKEYYARAVADLLKPEGRLFRSLPVPR